MRFLLGTWSGAGLVRGAAVTSRVVAEAFGPDMIRLDNETFRDGEVIHRERAVFRDRDGKLQATTSPWRGDAQVFDAVERDSDRMVFVCGDRYRWTIVRESDDAWRETFETADASGVLQTLVTLRHVRSSEG